MPWEASRVDMPGSTVSTSIIRSGSKSIRAGWLLAVAFACSAPSMAADAAKVEIRDSQSVETQAVVGLIDSGRFAEAESSIAGSLASPAASAETKSALLFQRERMRRILIDFTVDEAQAKARIRKQIPIWATRNSPAGTRPDCSNTRSSTVASCISIAPRPICFGSAPRPGRGGRSKLHSSTGRWRQPTPITGKYAMRRWRNMR